MGSTGQWILVRSQPKREAWAATNCVRQGYEVYFPRCQRIRGTRPLGRPIALFPTYIFVRTPGQWYFLRGTFGVAGPVLCGESPIVVPEHLVTELRSREGEDKIMWLHIDPVPGQAVRITSGPMKDQVGVHAGMSGRQRVRVLFDRLAVTVNRGDLVAA